MPQRFAAPANENVRLTVCDHRKRDKLQETLLSITPIKQLVSQCHNFCPNKIARQVAEKIVKGNKLSGDRSPRRLQPVARPELNPDRPHANPSP